MIYAGSGDGEAGWSLTARGDVDGDGVGDLLVGEPDYFWEGWQQGAAYLVRGPLTESRDLVDADAVFRGDDGWAGRPAAAGDVDGDGLPDLIFGDSGLEVRGVMTGGARVHLAPFSGSIPVDDADATLVGEDADDWAGIAVASAGDTDADGFADLLVGGDAYSDRFMGSAWLVRGPVWGTVELAGADVELVGPVGSGAGAGVASAGDVDGDGLDDLLVGGPEDAEVAEDAGAVWLVGAAGLP